MKKTLAAFAVILILAWLGAVWVLMLEVGVAHRDWWPALPAMSYHAALALAGIGVVFGGLIGIAKGFIEEAAR
jgi:hypothetical protein